MTKDKLNIDSVCGKNITTYHNEINSRTDLLHRYSDEFTLGGRRFL